MAPSLVYRTYQPTTTLQPACRLLLTAMGLKRWTNFNILRHQVITFSTPSSLLVLPTNGLPRVSLATTPTLPRTWVLKRLNEFNRGILLHLPCLIMTSVQLRRHCFPRHQITPAADSIVYEIFIRRCPSSIPCTVMFVLDIQALVELEHH